MDTPVAHTGVTEAEIAAYLANREILHPDRVVSAFVDNRNVCKQFMDTCGILLITPFLYVGEKVYMLLLQ